MEKIVKIYNKLVIAALATVVAFATSCTDYLTIIPSDKIVHENFWQNEDEVNGMLATAYYKLISNDAIQRAIIWGELRSDNMTYPTSNDKNIKYIVEANILEDNEFCKWNIYYEAINCANLVMEYAPLVLDRDPDFTEEDLKIVTGEMLALRALSHFYLVRSFRDIPLALVPAVNDSELPEYAQVHPMKALNSIMDDLDRAENMVVPSGSYADAANRTKNFGRITKNAVLAMKADVNLWRAAFATYYEGGDYAKPGDAQKYYDMCIQNCQDVIDNMDRKLEEEWNKSNTPVVRYPYNLLQNDFNEDDPTAKDSEVYDEIFGYGNSRESIFELQADRNTQNGGVKAMYGNNGNPGMVMVPSTFLNKNYTVDDLRAYSYTNAENLSGTGDGNTELCIVKYAATSSPSFNYRENDVFDANWIVYRRTDVLLMKAEALVARQSASANDLSEAFDIVKAINTRSRMDTTNISRPLNPDSYRTAEAALDLVMKERLLELSYEGKRWYDLVRKALREKSTNGILFVADKLTNNASVVKTKMSSIDGLFFPIHSDELKFNKLLKQNPAYKKEGGSAEMN